MVSMSWGCVSMLLVLTLVEVAIAGRLRAPSLPKGTPAEVPSILRALLGFQLLPPGTQKDPFVTNCSGAVAKRLPEMTQAYTAQFVPNVILHQCDIYVTKVHYQTKGGSMERAGEDCRAFGKKLIRAFEGDKNYKPWC